MTSWAGSIPVDQHGNVIRKTCRPYGVLGEDWKNAITQQNTYMIEAFEVAPPSLDLVDKWSSMTGCERAAAHKAAATAPDIGAAPAPGDPGLSVVALAEGWTPHGFPPGPPCMAAIEVVVEKIEKGSLTSQPSGQRLASCVGRLIHVAEDGGTDI